MPARAIWEERRIALQQSIDHWKRMIRWVDERYAEDLVDSIEMNRDLGEYWGCDDCALCELYQHHCFSCGFDCHGEGSKYSILDHTDTWGQWLTAAEGVLNLLKQELEALRGC